MKYYELYTCNFWADRGEYKHTELEVEKETPKQVVFKRTSAYLKAFNKTRLLQVQESMYTSYIIYPEGKEAEARKLLLEALERQLSYHKKKAQAFNELIKEVASDGKKEHN